MKQFVLILIIFLFPFLLRAQQANCVLLPPQFTIHFGAGNIGNPNSSDVYDYRRVGTFCPSDGYYSFASYTSACFNDDWHTIIEDHTPGDAGGNMLLVNAGDKDAVFLHMPVTRLKSNTVYEFGVWLMNLCKPTKKCPFPLLPDLRIQLITPEGNVVASIITGEVLRVPDPKWTQYRARFTTPASTSTLMLVMTDKIPSGCGNDFAVDDITFRECVKPTVPPPVAAIKKAPITKPAATAKTPQNKVPKPSQQKTDVVQVSKPKTDTAVKTISTIKQVPRLMTSAPLILKTRENTLARRIETEAGETRIDLYDNGEIDGDTVSIYHNNTLIRSRQRLSQKPISFTLTVDPLQSHHEVIMVAENLGSIPPNTSIMIITTASKRYEVFISSTEQKNAKVILDLKK